jgi:hypothetical protein
LWRRATRAEQRKEGGRRKEKGLTGGTKVSVAERKKKKSAGRPLRGREDWAGGPLGRKVRWFPFSFFPFPFSNSFQNKSFKFKFKQNFSNFFT